MATSSDPAAIPVQGDDDDDEDELQVPLPGPTNPFDPTSPTRLRGNVELSANALQTMINDRTDECSDPRCIRCCSSSSPGSAVWFLVFERTWSWRFVKDITSSRHFQPEVEGRRAQPMAQLGLELQTICCCVGHRVFS